MQRVEQRQKDANSNLEYHQTNLIFFFPTVKHAKRFDALLDEFGHQRRHSRLLDLIRHGRRQSGQFAQ